MPFVAALAFNVSEISPAARWHAVVAAEGDGRCLRGPQMHRTPLRFLELRNSHFLHENSRNNRSGALRTGSRASEAILWQFESILWQMKLKVIV